MTEITVTSCWYIGVSLTVYTMLVNFYDNEEKNNQNFVYTVNQFTIENDFLVKVFLLFND